MPRVSTAPKKSSCSRRRPNRNMAAMPAIPAPGFASGTAAPRKSAHSCPTSTMNISTACRSLPMRRRSFPPTSMRMTLGRMDRALAQTLVEQSNAAIHWMKDCRNPLGASQGARQNRQQALFRARHRHSRGGRRRGPAGAVAPHRRGREYRNPLFVRGQRDPRQHASRRGRARLHRREREYDLRPRRHRLRRRLPGQRRDARTLSRPAMPISSK